MGALGGTLKSFSAPELAALVLKGLLEGTDPGRSWEVILGQAVQAGCGPNPARTAALKAGLPFGTEAVTVNRGAASGLQAILQAVQSLQAGSSGILAGGMESSSSAPYLLPSARWGTRMGSAPVMDALLLDGPDIPQAPWSPAEASFVQQSRARTLSARKAGGFLSEITPFNVQTRRGALHLAEDEPPKAPGGALEPSDGAAVLMLVSEAALRDQAPLARIKATARGAGSAQAIQRLLVGTGLAVGDIDRFELDEACPAHPLQVLSAFPALSPDRVNVLGGAQALGHPLGASSARMVVSLAHQLRDNGLRYGITATETDGSGLALLLEHS